MQFDQDAYNARPINYLYNQLAIAGLTGNRLNFEGEKTMFDVLHKAIQTTANVAATSPIRLKRLFLALIMQDKDPFMGDFRTQDQDAVQLWLYRECIDVRTSLDHSEFRMTDFDGYMVILRVWAILMEKNVFFFYESIDRGMVGQLRVFCLVWNEQQHVLERHDWAAVQTIERVEFFRDTVRQYGHLFIYFNTRNTFHVLEPTDQHAHFLRPNDRMRLGLAYTRRIAFRVERMSVWTYRFSGTIGFSRPIDFAREYFEHDPATNTFSKNVFRHLVYEKMFVEDFPVKEIKFDAYTVQCRDLALIRDYILMRGEAKVFIRGAQKKRCKHLTRRENKAVFECGSFPDIMYLPLEYREDAFLIIQDIKGIELREHKSALHASNDIQLTGNEYLLFLQRVRATRPVADFVFTSHAFGQDSNPADLLRLESLMGHGVRVIVDVAENSTQDQQDISFLAHTVGARMTEYGREHMPSKVDVYPTHSIFQGKHRQHRDINIYGGITMPHIGVGRRDDPDYAAAVMYKFYPLLFHFIRNINKYDKNMLPKKADAATQRIVDLERDLEHLSTVRAQNKSDGFRREISIQNIDRHGNQVLMGAVGGHQWPLFREYIAEGQRLIDRIQENLEIWCIAVRDVHAATKSQVQYMKAPVLLGGQGVLGTGRGGTNANRGGMYDIRQFAFAECFSAYGISGVALRRGHTENEALQRRYLPGYLRFIGINSPGIDTSEFPRSGLSSMRAAIAYVGNVANEEVENDDAPRLDINILLEDVDDVAVYEGVGEHDLHQPLEGGLDEHELQRLAIAKQHRDSRKGGGKLPFNLDEENRLLLRVPQLMEDGEIVFATWVKLQDENWVPGWRLGRKASNLKDKWRTLKFRAVAAVIDGSDNSEEENDDNDTGNDDENQYGGDEEGYDDEGIEEEDLDDNGDSDISDGGPLVEGGFLEGDALDIGRVIDGSDNSEEVNDDDDMENDAEGEEDQYDGDKESGDDVSEEDEEDDDDEVDDDEGKEVEDDNDSEASDIEDTDMRDERTQFHTLTPTQHRTAEHILKTTQIVQPPRTPRQKRKARIAKNRAKYGELPDGVKKQSAVQRLDAFQMEEESSTENGPDDDDGSEQHTRDQTADEGQSANKRARTREPLSCGTDLGVLFPGTAVSQGDTVSAESSDCDSSQEQANLDDMLHNISFFERKQDKRKRGHHKPSFGVKLFQNNRLLGHVGTREDGIKVVVGYLKDNGYSLGEWRDVFPAMS